MKPEHPASPQKSSGSSGSNSCLVTALVVIVGGVVVIGILAAIAIPAFIKYINRSKASEAQAIVAKLQSSAIEYYKNSGKDGACHFPPSANPVPAGEPCCETVGPSDGSKWSAPAKTWSQEGWKELDFSINDPTYFAYQIMNTTNPSGTNRLEVRAFADFNAGGPRHTYAVTLEGSRNDQGECIATAGEPALTNEFE